ncbi:MAG TPA: TIGR03557 family F420-dependent LLM class oxidoreductase [Pseudomonadales bacterium]
MEALGFSLSSELCRPRELVDLARQAEQRGFDFALISDHFHPWVSAQGNSPFVWSVLGGIAAVTERLQVGTGVTCPLLRIHPAVIAQAAATTADLFQGRFFLGLGAGENLNEHVLGDRWPPPPERQDMLLEAIEILRELWEGDDVSFDGAYYQVDEARLFTLPERPPPIVLAASGPESARIAAEVCEGLMGVAPDADLVEAFDGAADGRRPKYAQVTLAWDPSEKAARERLVKVWPQSGLGGSLKWETKTYRLFDDGVKPLTEEQIIGKTPCGPDPEAHLEAIRVFTGAGYTHISLHQIGGDYAAFLEFAEKELRPRL